MYTRGVGEMVRSMKSVVGLPRCPAHQKLGDRRGLCNSKCALGRGQGPAVFSGTQRVPWPAAGRDTAPVQGWVLQGTTWRQRQAMADSAERNRKHQRRTSGGHGNSHLHAPAGNSSAEQETGGNGSAVWVAVDAHSLPTVVS
ncbi:hypothetical protein NDU88_004627 [Pleurodeles waltl]|uniref:Uncharacterized protein n=1 Tax=Pleurodeles waltl TaxID=8319 RepID=A0AAV7T9B8_PLEWA|nr:hypothetical protein NDU88_004627 [Pleurodeles waltl]